MRGRVRIVAVVVEGGVALAPREGEGGIEAGARRVRCGLGCGRGFALSLSTAGVCRVWGTKRQERVGHACAPHAHPPSKKWLLKPFCTSSVDLSSLTHGCIAVGARQQARRARRPAVMMEVRPGDPRSRCNWGAREIETGPWVRDCAQQVRERSRAER
ncbi:hypothetical protein B0H13DRAFT_2056081 [Mycena leptocephala]|nr:hypothetical protein B0H13DRAFT_2056081 [Mycena leptocephala]